MEQIKLTEDHIKVIQQDMRGEISLYGATPYQRKYLSEVLEMALDRLASYPDDYDSGDDLVEWFWNEYQKQENDGKE